MGALRLAALTLLCLGAGCGDRIVDSGAQCELPTNDTPRYFSISTNKEIDILIVLDTSPAIFTAWANWNVKATSIWMRLIDALKSPKLSNKIPNVHIGVVSADLGAGPYTSISGCKPGGDGGKLLVPTLAGCISPKDPWVTYIDGVTNIPNPVIKDPIEQVKLALGCIAEQGAKGCQFSQPLEAARRALDPKLNLHPGFLRNEAVLYLMFITAGDDCSAAKTPLFDPSQTKLTDPLGPLSTFRCFEFGVQCDCPGAGVPCARTTVGMRKSCRPSGSWLHKVEDYVTFFKGLKPPGRVIASVVSGPLDPVDVQLEQGLPVLKPSCMKTTGLGTPAIRLEAFIRALKTTGNKGYFNEGTDYTQTQSIPVTICGPDISPTVRFLGRLISTGYGPQCVPGTPLTEECGLACRKGVARGASKTCGKSCLHRADCSVEQRWIYDTTKQPVKIQRCPQLLFQSPDLKDCGTTCPCWRLATKCSPQIDGSPYSLQVLRKGESANHTVVKLTCTTSIHKWGSKGALALPECGD